MPATRTAAVLLGVLTIAGAAGCNQIFNRIEDGVVRGEAVAEVNIDGGSGDIAVVTDTTVKGVDIRRSVHYLDRAPSTDDTIVFNGGKVTLKTDCGPQCSASYEVRTPAAGVKVTGDNGSGNTRLTDVSDVDLQVGSGNITVERATGSVRLKTGSGDIELKNVGGNVTLNTGSGNVTGDDLRGATTAIEVSSGNVSLHLPGTGDVRAVTGSGNIEIWVPDRSARISVNSSTGNHNVNVTADPNSPRLLELRTGSGDVTVSPTL
jgi:hypothetical protein